jgi:fluoride exporter
LIRYLLVLFGGGVGALARYVAASAIMARFGGKFPLGTLVINVTGSFLIGFLMTMLTERFQLDPRWRLLLVVGFLGGYTTFSSFEWETHTRRSGKALFGPGCSMLCRALCWAT